jgi:hypothetical protein
MIHKFKSSLQHEREQALKADTFYRNVLNATEIKRFNSDSDSDMEIQRQDVDLLLTINETTYRVSEKFRDVDYGDLYVEVYSKYPKTPGWLHTGSPNAILYFTPAAVYWITHKSLASFCLQTLFPQIPETWYEEIFLSPKVISSKQLDLKGKSFKINLIKAHNKDGSTWETIGISAPFKVFEENGVKIRRFDLI